MAKKLYASGSDELFGLSRSVMDKFEKCPRCFYFHCVNGLREPDGPMSRLTFTFDDLLKNDFDSARRSRKVPKVLADAGFDLKPIDDPNLDDWRKFTKGIRATVPEFGFEVYGAVDDVLVDSQGKACVCDFKSTTGSSPVTVFGDKEHHASYKRQLEVYRWLLEKNNYQTSDKGYLIFGAADNTDTSFHGEMTFHMSAMEIQLNSGWIEDALREMKATLDSGSAPEPNSDCSLCNYWESRKAAENF